MICNPKKKTTTAKIYGGAEMKTRRGRDWKFRFQGGAEISIFFFKEGTKTALDKCISDEIKDL